MQSGKLLPPPPSITYKTVLLYQISRIDYIKYKIYTKNSSKNQRFFSSLIFSSLVHRISKLAYLKKYINVSRQLEERINHGQSYLRIYSIISKSIFGGISIYAVYFRSIEEENKTVCPISVPDFEWNVRVRERARVFGPPRGRGNRRRDFNGTNTAMEILCASRKQQRGEISRNSADYF